MLAPGGRDDRSFRPIIVGIANADPYVEHADAIRALGQHYGLSLERSRCRWRAALPSPTKPTGLVPLSRIRGRE
jgi:hypothetical protein